MATRAGDGVVLHFDHKPAAILAAITGIRRRLATSRARVKLHWPVPLALVGLGVGLLLLDVWLGYGRLYFVWVGLIVIAIGLWTASRLRVADRQPSFNQPEIDSAHRVIHTLRDDVATKANLHGTLDLTGARAEGKVSRTAQDGRGRHISYYRDEWLMLKAKLYDGSMLRFSVVRRLKVRDSYYKRGRVSGRQKLKPEVVKGERQVIDVRVSANPALYEVRPELAPVLGAIVGTCTVEAVTVDGGIVRVTATNGEARPSPDEILEILRLTYAALKRKDAA